ncbi:hypothetical protein MVEN_02543400 [Mycena venus]|uniref:Uncharacterized protein n=1 Tax=Mycena venus TaxID=2733690 RepID=A0A8H6U436_9AGAR|nr:hypothetical protein MVEN_02543400 [Mycena venus]
MFFRTSVALSLVLSFSVIAVYSAPLKRADFVPQACSGPNGTGTCVDLNVTVGDGPGACTNVNAPKSLILNVDNDCVSIPGPDCNLDFEAGDVAVEHFSDDADINNLSVSFQSISCQQIPGLVNGLFPQ